MPQRFTGRGDDATTAGDFAGLFSPVDDVADSSDERSSAHDEMTIRDGTKIAVIGGGPAGSLFSMFLLRSLALESIEVELDIFEPRQFMHAGPAGCNHCGGIISESLVQMLATEGITLPPQIVRRGIESYMLHMDVGSVSIETKVKEKRIAAVYRGNGPKTSVSLDYTGFDRFLLESAEERGATIRRKLVTGVEWVDGKPQLESHDGLIRSYDLVVVATGVNSLAKDIIAKKDLGLDVAKTVKTFISEFYVGRDEIAATLGNSMHVFLLKIPRLEFAALIPKGDYVTICLLGHEIDEDLVNRFMNSKEVRERFRAGTVPAQVCHCFPRINVQGARKPFADRIVFIGDAGVTRLYKDGIGAAYRTAKAAAVAVAVSGFSDQDFATHYWPACKRITSDNALGELVFAATHFAKKSRFLRRGILHMTRKEQTSDRDRPLSGILWDVFTGSATLQGRLPTGNPSKILGDVHHPNPRK